MKSLKELIADSSAKIIVSRIKQKSTILKELIDNPENVIVETYIESGEIIVKVKKKS